MQTQKLKQNSTAKQWNEAIVLQGRKLRLEPLGLQHLDDLAKNLLSPTAWHCVQWGIRSKTDLQQNIQQAVQAQSAGTGNSFAMVLNSTQEAVGKSHLMAFSQRHNFLEIGGTWVGQSFHRTFVNSEAKYLMLSYVFEGLGCQRVEFRADALNFNSQRAILRIGAKYEGELRSACRLPDGRKRDYKVYSIIESEWPNVKAHLKGCQDHYV